MHQLPLAASTESQEEQPPLHESILGNHVARTGQNFVEVDARTICNQRASFHLTIIRQLSEPQYFRHPCGFDGPSPRSHDADDEKDRDQACQHGYSRTPSSALSYRDFYALSLDFSDMGAIRYMRNKSISAAWQRLHVARILGRISQSFPQPRDGFV